MVYEIFKLILVMKKFEWRLTRTGYIWTKLEELSEKQVSYQGLSELKANNSSQQQAVFEVGGMACAFCATTIEGSLSQVKGIESVKVLMNTSEVIVRYNPDQLDHNSVKKHLIRLGYYAFDESEKTHSDTTILKDSRKRALAAAAITAPVTVLAFLSFMLGVFNFGIGFKLFEMTTSAVVLFYFGLPIHIGAFNALKRRILNEHVLYGAAGFAAYAVGLLSLFYTSAPDFFNVAALLTTFHLTAGWYGAKVRNDTTKSLRKILNLQPPTARLVREKKNGETEETIIVPVSEVKVDDLIVVKGGEKISVDGIVESGESTVSEAILTGESEPVHKRRGDSVLAGSTNGDGLLLIRTSKVGSETMLMRVAGNVKQIQEAKPLLLTIFDKVIDKFVIAVLALASLTAAGWIVFNVITGANEWLQTIYAPLSVLVIGYPCAIGLSTPPVKLRAISIAADKGVLINDASSLFAITKADIIVLDKTGTITEGRPRVNKIVTFGRCSKQLVLEHAACIEMGSSHPIANAIVKAAGKNGIKLKAAATDTKQFPGKGLKGSFDIGRDQVVIGTQEFLEEQGIIGITEEELKTIRSIDSPVLVAFNGNLEGALGVSDNIRQGIETTIMSLMQKGFDIIMLTGDSKTVAEKVASRLGIMRFEARMSPMEKTRYVRTLQADAEGESTERRNRRSRAVIAVGDGVNDAPALAQADAGMAVSSGIDISKETAAFVLLTDDIGVIPTLVNLGKKFTAAVKRNIFLALAFNVIGIPIAAMGFLNPFTAMLIMIADVSAVFASTRLLRRLPTKTESSEKSYLKSASKYRTSPDSSIQKDGR
jgi:heavy metal translocating P-type ATPase